MESKKISYEEAHKLALEIAEKYEREWKEYVEKEAEECSDIFDFEYKIMHRGNDKCPNCKAGYLYPGILSGLLGVITQKIVFHCNNCNASIKIDFKKKK